MKLEDINDKQRGWGSGKNIWPSKIEVFEKIVSKFVTVDYVYKTACTKI